MWEIVWDECKCSQVQCHFNTLNFLLRSLEKTFHILPKSNACTHPYLGLLQYMGWMKAMSLQKQPDPASSEYMRPERLRSCKWHFQQWTGWSSLVQVTICHQTANKPLTVPITIQFINAEYAIPLVTRPQWVNSLAPGKFAWNFKYRQLSNIRRTKSQNLNVSCLVLQLSVPNPLKPSVKKRMKV